MEEYKGEGLRGPGWTIAGVEILRAIKEVVDELRGGGHRGGGVDAAAITAAIAPALAAAGSGCGGANAELLAENAQLKAERYSDNAAKEQADRLLTNYLKPYGDEIADARVREAKLQAEFNGYKEVVDLRIKLAEQEAKCCCEKANARIDCLETRLNAITKTVVPSAAVEKAA